MADNVKAQLGQEQESSSGLPYKDYSTFKVNKATQFKSNDKLKAYIQKIDDLAKTLEIDIAKNLPWFTPVLNSEAFATSQEIVRLGCRVWVRWLNDVDRALESNKQFVEQKSDNNEGIKGQKFWKIIVGDINPFSAGNTSISETVNLMPYFYKLAPYGTAVSAVVGQLTDTTGKQKYVQDTIIQDLTNLLQTFGEFWNEFKTEYYVQFPEEKPQTQPITNEEKKDPLIDVPKAGTQSGIVEVVTEYYQYIILAVILIGLWWYSKRN